MATAFGYGPARPNQVVGGTLADINGMGLGGGGSDVTPWGRGNVGSSSSRSSMSSGPMTLSQMLAMQREENAKTKAQNLATRQATLNELSGVPTAFAGDPLWQATRQSAQNLVANPEAINDQTQQKIINRQSNLVNAASNTSRDQARQQMAAMGLLGGSAEQQALQGIENNRIAGLTDAATTLEIERAKRRNQDILASQQMGAALAGQQSGVNQWAAGTRANTDLYFQPENLSGYAGYFAQQGRGGGGLGSGFGLNNSAPNMGQLQQGWALNSPSGPNSPGQTGFSPGLRGNYQWTGQMSGGYAPAFQGPSDAWKNYQQEQDAMNWSRSFNPGQIPDEQWLDPQYRTTPTGSFWGQATNMANPFPY